MAQQENVNLKDVKYTLKKLGEEISSDDKINSLAYKFKHSEPDYNKEEITSSFEAVKSRVKALNSELFFIVVFGALKAGKSTLTNLLTGMPEISPTKFGEECTMRPSIIIGTKDGESEGMVQYFRKPVSNGGGLDDFALFSNIMAHLRVNEVLNERYIDKRGPVPLDPERLSEALAQKEDSVEEPLITIIKVCNSEILKSQDGVNIALVDMPGLDGKKANSDDPVYQWTQAESDFLIMVQSDFAALSGSIMDYLNTYERKDEDMAPEIWVLLNKMEVTPWRHSEKLKETEDERREHATNRLIEALNDKRAHGLKFNQDNISSVNLGKASDYYFNRKWIDTDKNPNILKDSGYPEFLNNFGRRIDSRKEILLSISLIGRLKKVLENLAETFKAANVHAESARKTAMEAALKLLYDDDNTRHYDQEYENNLPDGLPEWLDKPSNFYPNANSANILLKSNGLEADGGKLSEEVPQSSPFYDKLKEVVWSKSDLKAEIKNPKDSHLTEYLKSIEETLKNQINTESSKIRKEYDLYDMEISQKTEDRINMALNLCGISRKIEVKKPNRELEVLCNFDDAGKWKKRKIKEVRIREKTPLMISFNVDAAQTEAAIHKACSEDLEQWLKNFAEETKQTAIDKKAPIVRSLCRDAVKEALSAINDKLEKAATEIGNNKGHIQKIEEHYIKELDDLLRKLHQKKEAILGNG